MAGKVSVWLAARLAARSYPARNFLAATAYFVLDPFHLDFSACAMDWRVKSTGSRGEHVSEVASRAHSCISLALVVVKTSHFTATRWTQKISAVYTLHHWSNKSQESRETSVV